MIELLCTDYNKKATFIHYNLNSAVLDNRAFELVEQGIYTTEQFIQRRDDLQKRKTDRKEQIKDLESKRDKLQAAMSVEIDLVPQMEHVINAFPIATAEERKELLQSVFDRIEYTVVNLSETVEMTKKRK